MLLESNLNDRSVVVFDAETVAAIDKGGLTVRGHPDKVLDGMVAVIRTLARELRAATTTEPGEAPLGVEVRFGLKVDSNGIVAVARTSGDGQVGVTLRL